ncbi:superoxide dismutase [Candidatus Wolfebacteria bacterium]|nr:MAG: superoxide dismutase [Candidatus Wolfebacteria bacterium]
MYQLPLLQYEYDALEPYIDAATMKIHHTKHHQGYVTKLNDALEPYPELAKKSIEDLLQSLDSVPEEIRVAVRRNAGGHHNHSLFWMNMMPNGGGGTGGQLAQAITDSFGDFSTFKNEFNSAALSVFGSGWAWLIKDADNKLKIITTHNQDSPLMEGVRPILGLDIWEHAYYLNYQNRRPEYVDAWWNVINWEQVEKNFNS